MAPIHPRQSQNNGLLLFHLIISLGPVLFLLILQFMQPAHCIPNYINHNHNPNQQRSSRNSNNNNNRLGLPQRSEQLSQYMSVPQEGFSRIVPLGNPFTLHCGIQLDEYNLIDSYWTVNGSQITVDNEHFEVSDLDLTIDSIRQEDQGTYRCVLKFSQGILLGPPYTLNILAFHVLHDSTNTQFEYFVGQNIILKCPVYSVPPGVVTWKSLSTAEGSLPRFIVLNSGELVIRNLRSDDSGSYECSVKHKNYPEPISSRAHLLVLTGPDLTPVSLLPTFPNIVRLKEESISYYCLTNKASVPTGWESLYITPDDQGNPIVSRSEYFGEVIKLSRINGTGENICSASTLSGVISKRLISSLAPNFPNLPIMKHPPAKTVRFECRSSEPVRWYKDGVLLIPNTGRVKQHKPWEILISNTIQSDSGFYQCESGSRIGTGFLIVEPTNNQPDPPINLRCYTQSSKSILVQWENPNSQSRIQAYSIHYTTAGGKENTRVTNNSTFLVDNLFPNTNYSIYVTSYTTAGASGPSTIAKCSTFEDYPITGPEVNQNPQLQVGPTQLSLRWEPLSPTQARGIIQEYKLQWRKERSSTFSHIIYLYGDVTETVITGLEPCTSYSFRISPANSLGFSPMEESFQWTSLNTKCTNLTFAPPPLAPQLQDIYNSSSFRIEWTNPSMNRTIQGYKIFLAHEVPGSSGVYLHMSPIIVYDPAITSYTFTNLVPLTRYQLRISYFGEDWESDLSAKIVIETSETTTAHEVLLPVTEIQASSSPSAVYLNWTAPSPRIFPEVYLVKYNLVGSDEFFVDKSEELHYTVDRLLPFRRYEFSIGYELRGKEGPYSEKVEIKTLEGAPGPPSLLDYQVLSNTSVRIRWNPPIPSSGPIKSYKISSANDSQFSAFREFLTNETSIILQLHPGQKVWVRIAAETEAGGVGPQSEAIKVEIFRPNISTTTPGPPVTTSESLEDKDKKQRINTIGIIIGIVLALVCIVICVVILACHNRVFTYIITHCRRRSRRDNRAQGTGKDTVDSGPGMVEMRILTSQEILDTKGGHPNGTVVSLSNCDGLSANDPLLLRRPDVPDPIECPNSS